MPTTPLMAALLKRLRVSNKLDANDERAVQALPIEGKSYRPQQKIVSDRDRPGACCLIIEGFAFRSKTTAKGERQILSLHIPGEIPDLQSLHLHVMDHDLTTLTECTLGFIPHAALHELSRSRPNVAAALWRETLIDAAIFREWIVNVGRRQAIPRMAHLLSELLLRLEAIGRARNGAFELPITQSGLADCLGLTSIHTNRVLKQLRIESLVALEKRVFKVLDRAKLEELGQFDRTYLHQHPSA
jgi:CRP-like cAMP-binding protein